MHDIIPEHFYQIIGKNVAKHRKAKGLSQLDLSLQMGYKSDSVVSDFKFVKVTNIST